MHIYDPVSGVDQIVALSKSPFCLSVSPDGLSAAVGSDGWVSIVNLSTAAITKTLQTFTDVHSALLGGNGYVYAFPQDTWGDMFSIEIATGAINLVNAIYTGRDPQLYIDGKTVYTESAKWDISQGPAKAISSNLANGICPPFWLTEDGARAISSCAKAYTTSPIPSLDLQYNGSFSNASNIQWASESAKLHTTAIIPGLGSSGLSSVDTAVQLYGDAYLGYAGSLSLPSFNSASTAYTGHGRYVFWNKAADKLIILEQADSSANLSADYGAMVLPLTGVIAGCTFSLNSASALFSAGGGLDTVNISSGAGCVWEAVSNVSWITVNSGAVGFGANPVGYSVAANTGGSRTGTLTIAGQTFTVTQSGQGVQGTPAQIASPVAGSTLGRAVTFYWQPATGFLQYRLDVGSSATTADIFSAVTTNSFASVSGLPCDGRTVYVALYTWFAGASDYQQPALRNSYQASTNCATAAIQLGVFRPPTPVGGALGVFALDNNGSYSFDASDRTTQFGLAGDYPVAGDWDGTGVKRLGVFRCPPVGQGICSWYLDQNNNGIWDSGDIWFQFGLPGDVPVVGDWSNTGVSKVGVMRCPAVGQPGVCTWYLDVANKRVPNDPSFRVVAYGLPGDQPAVGPWAFVGDQVGVFRCPVAGVCSWIVDSSGLGYWQPSDTVYSFGSPGDIPVVGQWNGQGTVRIGVFRSGQWYLDLNGNGRFDSGDEMCFFGLPGDKPVVGFWSMHP